MGHTMNNNGWLSLHPSTGKAHPNVQDTSGTHYHDLATVLKYEGVVNEGDNGKFVRFYDVIAVEHEINVRVDNAKEKIQEKIRAVAVASHDFNSLKCGLENIKLV